MQEARHQFRESLKELEQQTLGGLDMVAQQLDRALESVSFQDVELAETVIADDERIDGAVAWSQSETASGTSTRPTERSSAWREHLWLRR